MIPQDPIPWLDVIAAIQAEKLPTNEECIAIFDRIRHSAEMDASKILLHEPAKRAWQDFAQLLKATCTLIREKNVGNVYQTFRYQSLHSPYPKEAQIVHQLNYLAMFNLIITSREFAQVVTDLIGLLRESLKGFESMQGVPDSHTEETLTPMQSARIAAMLKASTSEKIVRLAQPSNGKGKEPEIVQEDRVPKRASLGETPSSPHTVPRMKRTPPSLYSDITDVGTSEGEVKAVHRSMSSPNLREMTTEQAASDTKFQSLPGYLDHALRMILARKFINVLERLSQNTTFRRVAKDAIDAARAQIDPDHQANMLQDAEENMRVQEITRSFIMLMENCMYF